MYETLCVTKLLIWRQKWVAGVRHGNSLVVRRVSPGRIIVVLFWTKYAVPRQIKPRILRLTNRRGQSNLSIVFSFVSCEEKAYYRVVSVGQLSFACHSHCGRSRRMQGKETLSNSVKDCAYSYLYSYPTYFSWSISHKQGRKTALNRCTLKMLKFD